MSTVPAIKFPYTPKQGEEIPKTIQFNGCNFATYTWLNINETYKGRILIVHGYRDQYGTYYRLIEFFICNGYDVFYYSQRGEGKSRLLDGTVGTTSDEHIAKDLDYMIEYNLTEMQEQGKESKLHLFAHSMGGGIVLNYGISGTHKSKLRSIATTAPLIELAPQTQPSLLIEWIVRGCCMLPFMRTTKVKTSLNHNYLTADEDFLKFFAEKAKTENLAGTFIEVRDFILRGRKLLKFENYSKMDKKIPILVCHGDRDFINDYNASDKFINQCLNTIKGMENKKLIKFEGGRHSLVIDVCYEEVQNDLLEFYNTYN